MRRASLKSAHFSNIELHICRQTPARLEEEPRHRQGTGVSEPLQSRRCLRSLIENLAYDLLYFGLLPALRAKSRSAWSPRPPSLFEAKSQLASPSRSYGRVLRCIRSRIQQPHALTDRLAVIRALGASAFPTNLKFAGFPKETSYLSVSKLPIGSLLAHTRDKSLPAQKKVVHLLAYVQFLLYLCAGFAERESDLCVLKEKGHTKQKESRNSLSVNQLGLEPRTPSLKGMCSTC